MNFSAKRIGRHRRKHTVERSDDLMKIIKRNSSEEVFNGEKIVNAVTKANKACDRPYLTPEQIKDIAEYVEYKCMKMGRAVSVEEIQDMVEDQIMAKGAFELARRYVKYRYNRSLVRRANTTKIRLFINRNNSFFPRLLYKMPIFITFLPKNLHSANKSGHTFW